MGRVDVALEEFKALRAEILGHQQAQTTILSVALTAIAAIGGIAFAAKAADDQRLEILLALPLVLSGLGLAHLTHSYGQARIGKYIETQLWPALQSALPEDGSLTKPTPSWEKQGKPPRGLRVAVTSTGGWLTFLPGIMIFGAPSLAALIINSTYALHREHGAGLQQAWWIDLVVTAASVVLLLLAGRARTPEVTSPAASR